MERLNQNEFKFLESLVSLTQNSMRRALYNYLKKRYKKVIVAPEYLYAVGEIPIALVAHMDTVFASPPQDVYYDERKGVCWSPDGLGADDRAGIFAILTILKHGYRPSIIFTTDEEIGAVGAVQLVEDIKTPESELKYIIQLDRRGTNDCVFYDCDNKDFVEYVENFGFIETFGSFSDISVICPAWGVAGVNLSIGYEDEHSTSEILHVAAMMNTIHKVENMLDEKDIPFFEYIEYSYAQNDWNYYFRRGKRYNWYDEIDADSEYNYGTLKCSKCNKYFHDYELIPALSKDGNKTKYYCPDCCTTEVDWCTQCNNAFEIDVDKPATICPACRIHNAKMSSKKKKNKVIKVEELKENGVQ